MKRQTEWGLTFEDQIAFRMWPELANGSHLLDVVEIAKKSTMKGDIPHSIAAILLYQQLAEELLYLLDYWCFYENALKIFPKKTEYIEPKRVMFGELLTRIKQQQYFEGKKDFLKACIDLNSKCRIPIAHKLTDKKNLSNCKKTIY